jgi:hypothetical protein
MRRAVLVVLAAATEHAQATAARRGGQALGMPPVPGRLGAPALPPRGFSF